MGLLHHVARSIGLQSVSQFVCVCWYSLQCGLHTTGEEHAPHTKSIGKQDPAHLDAIAIRSSPSSCEELIDLARGIVP